MLKKIKKLINSKIFEPLFGFQLILNRVRGTRPSIEFVKKKFRRKIIAAEIGTQRGHNAKNMLEELNIRKIYLIDPWVRYKKGPCKVYKKNHYKMKKTGCDDTDVDEQYIQCLRRISPWENKVTIMKEFSNIGVKKLPDRMDFIYVDGNHTYEYVKKDIELSYAKLRKGGVLAGHDAKNVDVLRAVTEFTNKKRLRLRYYDNDWWFVR